MCLGLGQGEGEWLGCVARVKLAVGLGCFIGQG